MVKMDYSSVPNTPLKTRSMCPKILSKSAPHKWAQSSAIVRRLMSQPNVVVKSVSVPAVEDHDPKKQVKLKDYMKSQVNSTKEDSISNLKQSEISLVRANMLSEEPEDANLLPSKKENKKSDISFFPIKPKSCGCAVSCEKIICDVIVQQYVDDDGEVSFLLAVNIDEEEIDALVTKHCDNEYCDALSIDHNCCRRGLIKLYKCDQSDTCDICKVNMSGWKSRLHHKGCEKEDAYRHNNVSRERLLKDRFHLQELQILEDSKIRRNNYLDPVNGFTRALQTIRNNKELVIIPKTKSSQTPIDTVTSVPSSRLTCTTPSSTNQPITVNSQTSNQRSIVGNVITLSPHSNVALVPNSALSRLKEESVAQPMGPMQLSNLQKNAYIVTSPNTGGTLTRAVAPLQNQNFRIVNAPSSIVQPATVNNLFVPQSQIATSSSFQPKPLLTQIRVMPITTLKTAPSLLHRQQGIPKFCVMAGNMITTLTVPNTQAFQSILAANLVTQQKQVPKVQPNTSKVLTPALKRAIRRKSKKRFYCVYCTKHFSTEWYFKKHVSRHVNEKHTPKVLVNPLSNRHGTKRHPSKKLDVQEELGNDHVRESSSSAKNLVDKTGDLAEAHGSRIKVEFDPEHCDEHFADRTNNRATTIGDAIEVGGKRIKCEETFDTWRENVEIFRNGIKIEVQDDVESLEGIPLEEHEDNEEPLTFNENAKGNEIRIVSVVGNVNSANFEEEGIKTPR